MTRRKCAPRASVGIVRRQRRPHVARSVDAETRAAARRRSGRSPRRASTRLADDRRIGAEALTPQPVGEDAPRGPVPDELLLVGEVASERRLHAERRKQARRRRAGRHALGRADAARQVRVADGVPAHRRQQARLLLGMSWSSGTDDGHVEHALHRELAVEDDERARVAIGQRPQQHAVDDAEDGGVGADAERQRDNRRRRHARRPAQHAQREPRHPSRALVRRRRALGRRQRRAQREHVLGPNARIDRLYRAGSCAT